MIGFKRGWRGRREEGVGRGGGSLPGAHHSLVLAWLASEWSLDFATCAGMRDLLMSSSGTCWGNVQSEPLEQLFLSD